MGEMFLLVSSPLGGPCSKPTPVSASATMLKKQWKHPSPRLRAILQSDLKLVSPRSFSQITKSNNNCDDHHNVNTNKKKRCLEDYHDDIDKLLTSLQSVVFVGQVDPQYHAQFLVPDTITISNAATASTASETTTTTMEAF
jgi:hypothetical protein